MNESGQIFALMIKIIIDGITRQVTFKHSSKTVALGDAVYTRTRTRDGEPLLLLNLPSPGSTGAAGSLSLLLKAFSTSPVYVVHLEFKVQY